MIWKRVKDLVGGEIISEKIVGVNEQDIIATPGSVVDEDLKNKLLERGIEWVLIDIQKKTGKPLINEETLEDMKKRMKSIFDEITKSFSVNVEEVKEISSQIVEEVLANWGMKILPLLLIAKSEDEYTYTHEVNVGVLASMIAMQLGLNKDTISKLAFSAIIHDIGKLKIPKEILHAPRTLSNKEFELIKRHTIFGRQMCESSGIKDEDILSGIESHHEKMDGSGYLKGLSGNKISLFARIITVADIYDALTSKRSYKDPWSPHKVITELVTLSTLGKLDKKVVNAFVSVVGIYPVGTNLILSDGSKAVVVGNKRKVLTRPIVEVENGAIVDLSEDEKGLNILKVIN